MDFYLQKSKSGIQGELSLKYLLLFNHDFFTLLVLCIAYVGFSQTMYWAVYNMKVNNGAESKVLTAIDKYMMSETGKSVPTAAVTAKLFGSSEKEFSYQVIFSILIRRYLEKCILVCYNRRLISNCWEQH